MKAILQKIIAASGYSSRREAEKLIKNGKVKINGRLAVPGDMADSSSDKISIKGKLIATQAASAVYIKLNKPVGFTCTNRRFPGEKNIFDLVRVSERMFAVGRLDKGSRGLVLLTNDGALAQRLAHPRFEHEKVYEVKASGQFKNPGALLGQLIKGVDLGEGDGLGRAKHASVKEVFPATKNAAGKYLQKAVFIITLSEGKKRQIRRMFKALEIVVLDIKRVNLAGLPLGELPEGRWEHLSTEELELLNYEPENVPNSRTRKSSSRANKRPYSQSQTDNYRSR